MVFLNYSSIRVRQTKPNLALVILAVLYFVVLPATLLIVKYQDKGLRALIILLSLLVIISYSSLISAVNNRQQVSRVKYILFLLTVILSPFLMIIYLVIE